MVARIQFKRGLKANQPTTGMLAGEHFYHTDRSTMIVATGATTSQPLVPPIDDLATLASIDGAADFIMVHDADGTGMKEKKITFNNFKAALAIPAGSTDEKAAIVAGGTPGFIWGTTGSDGLLRMGAGLAWTKDAGNGFVTLEVGTVDCGTF